MPDLELGKRERQITEAVFRLGEASVADVLKELNDPPTYSSVRAMATLIRLWQQRRRLPTTRCQR